MADTSVVIVGAGPVGLITALGLARADVDVTVLEAKPAATPGEHDMIYHWTVLEGLDRLGVLDDMRTAGLVGRLWTVDVPSTGERITIDLSGLASDVAHPYTVHLSPDRLTEVVLAQLRGHRHATVQWGARVTDVDADRDGVTVTVEGPHGSHEVRAHWVVGTDGAHSIVRRNQGIGFPGTTWPHRFVATTTGFDWTEVGFTEVTYRVDDDCPALAGRIDDLWRFIYAEPRSHPVETIPSRMAAVFRTVLGADTDPLLRGWSAYRVHERAADRFRAGRVLLAGDAAHVTNPTTSLGLAGGLLDSFALTAVLVSVVHGDHDDSVLDLYASERRRVFWETASPLSSRAMHLLLGAGSPEHLDEALEPYRRAAADPRMLLETYREFGDLETRSLR
ncbi:FAD-dependent monooxygenase [Nocardia vinacea]|uniref:FAD-dependent monooxygenase n=1 Tax=Nocardia vinacea TaxID=96468 RepID=A0ABZ1YTB9_9NOCA|nr:FAD-dependent monooxygenase [Nocardia vinacea]